MLRTAAIATTSTVIAATYAAYAARPRPSSAGEANLEFFRRAERCEDGALLRLARSIMVYPAYLGMRAWMVLLNRVDIHDAEKMHAAVLRRDAGRGLITVSNHCSVLDDPGLLCAGVLPSQAFIAPSLIRWGLCAERGCFEKGALLQTFFGACRGIPINRFGGVDQPAIRTCTELVRKGEHLQLFPEGRIYQDPYVPRDERGRWTTSSGRAGAPFAKLGPLRRGVGKVIADATVSRPSDGATAFRARGRTPLIVPFFHIGMEAMAPVGEDRQSRTLRWGAHVVVKVGDPIDVDDLIDAYEEQRCRGKKVVGGGGDVDDNEEGYLARLEDELHLAITDRIESALLRLEAEVRAIAKRDGVVVAEPQAGDSALCASEARESRNRLRSSE